MKSLEGKKVKVLIDDIEMEGELIAGCGKFPVISISSRYNFEISFNSAYKAVYMNEIIRI